MTDASDVENVPQRRPRWSIGLFSGPEPERLEPMFRGPVVTAEMVHDVAARYVADPCLLQHQGRWHMFFEILQESGHGVIGLATSTNLETWRYERVVLEVQTHLSYPHVFCVGQDKFMVVESLGLECVSLFVANNFPYEWRFHCALVSGQHADPTVFHQGGRWWMFTCPRPYGNDRLHLYFADELSGPWSPHPANPLVDDDPTRARPAGPVVPVDGRLVRFAQNCVPVYGTAVRCFEIKLLTQKDYEEAEVILPSAFRDADLGWNALGMHHVAMHPMPSGGYVACVDGRS